MIVIIINVFRNIEFNNWLDLFHFLESKFLPLSPLKLHFEIVIINIQPKRVEGLSLDYVGLNISGYVFLSTYSTAGYLDSKWEIG